MTKLLLTVEEAAEMIGIGRSKVYELLNQGAIESIKIGKVRRIPTDALETYVAQLRRDEQAIPEAVGSRV